MAGKEILFTTFNRRETQQRFLEGDPETIDSIDRALSTLSGDVLADLTADVISSMPKGNNELDRLGRRFTLDILPRFPFKKVEPKSWKKVDSAFVQSLLAQKDAPDQLSAAALSEAGRILAPYMGSNTTIPGEIRKALNEIAGNEDTSETTKTNIDETNKALGLVFIETHTGRHKAKKYQGEAFRFYEKKPKGSASEFNDHLKESIKDGHNITAATRRQAIYLNYPTPLTKFMELMQVSRSQIAYHIKWLRDKGLLDPAEFNILQRRKQVLEDINSGMGKTQIVNARGYSNSSVDRDIQALRNENLIAESLSKIVPRRRATVWQLMNLGMEYDAIAAALDIPLHQIYTDAQWFVKEKLKKPHREKKAVIQPEEHSDTFRTIARTLIDNTSFSRALLAGGAPRDNALAIYDSHVDSLTESEQKDFGIFVIQGVSGTNKGRRWNRDLIEAGTMVFPLISLTLGKESLEEIQNAYIQGVYKQEEVLDPQRARALITIGKTLLPHLPDTDNGALVKDMTETWKTAVAEKTGDWQEIAEQAKTLSAVLGLFFIEKLSDVSQDDPTSVFVLFQNNPDITLAQIRDAINLKEVRSRETKPVKHRPSARRLEVWERFQELGSVTAVARSLGISDSVVSRHLDSLSEEGYPVGRTRRASPAKSKQNRQRVFLDQLENIPIADTANALENTQARVAQIRTWLRDQELIEYTHAPRPTDEFYYQLMLQMFYQGIRHAEMNRMTKLDSDLYINELRRRGDIVGRKPSRSDVVVIRNTDYPSQEAATRLRLSVQTVEGVRALPGALFQIPIVDFTNGNTNN